MSEEATMKPAPRPNKKMPVENVRFFRKLLAVRQHMTGVGKQGYNEHHGYKYTRAEDVIPAFEAACEAAGVVFWAECLGVETIGNITRVHMGYRILDPETGDSYHATWVGDGADKHDKGIYKAYTGALKYWIIQSFLVNTSEHMDPEDPAHEPDASSPAPDRKKSNEPTPDQLDGLKQAFAILELHGETEAVAEARAAIESNYTKAEAGKQLRKLRALMSKHVEQVTE